MSNIVNGNKVYFDEVRGRWTVLFVPANIAKQFASEEEAIIAAGGDPGTLKNESAGVIPKQAADNALTKKSIAVSELDNQVQASITQTVASEGSVLNTTVGNEKDGFTSLTAATTKGTANEGPAVAVMGANIKQGNVTKTVSASAKLSSVTGGTKGTTAVLNETVVQASPKGISKALTTTVGLSSTQVQAAISESSPIPSQAQAAVKAEVEAGGPAAVAATNAVAAAAKVSQENGNSFGSINPFGSIGSAFGNIMGQVVASAFGGSTYKNPFETLKIAASATIRDRLGNVIPTPNLVNNNGATNLTKTLTKSKLENARIKTLPNTVKPGERTKGYIGINTKLKGFNVSYDVEDYPNIKEQIRKESEASGVAEGGTYLLPILNNQSELEGEFTALERPITTLIIRHDRPYKKKVSTRFSAEIYHIASRRQFTKKYGAAALNNNPEDYVFPGHIFINDVGNLKIITPFTYEIPKKAGIKEYIPNAIVVYIQGEGDQSPITPSQFEVLGLVCKSFLKIYPGGEILGINDVNDRSVFRNNPFFNVRDFVKSKFRKPSVTAENEKAVVPSPADLADATPKNIVLPKKSPNNRPNLSAVAVTQNKIANPSTNINVANYSSNQVQALKLIKDRKNAVKIADLSTGSGLTSSLSSVANLNSGTSLSSSLLNSVASGLGPIPIGKIGLKIAGGIIDKITRTDAESNTLLNDTQSFKIEQLKIGKVFDSITGVFK